MAPKNQVKPFKLASKIAIKPTKMTSKALIPNLQRGRCQPRQLGGWAAHCMKRLFFVPVLHNVID